MSLHLGIVVPCYNEEAVLPETAKRLLALLERLASTGLVTAASSVYFVDDGSKDKTWSLIEGMSQSDSRIHGIKLSRNQGHQNALIAGLFGAQGDVLVSIDADLQDDVDVIEEMVRKYVEGFEIVYGVRQSRGTDTRFKRGSAELYYWLLAKMGVDIVHNHADYRLMGRRALDALQGYSEVNLFLRGIVPLLGFRATTAYYDRSERFAGESKYPLRKMLALALDGITSFSVVPLRMISMLGFLVSLFSVLMIGWVLYGKMFTSYAIPGWASSIIPIYFLGGIQLLSIGVLGEYVAKIYLETKRRPRYLIEKVI
ncbi:MAG: glycosyltransferase family 2 protein [Thiobacillus sp.]|nr:glycosyltransferase family 2 protein [Thiobacillus sp.]